MEQLFTKITIPHLVILDATCGYLSLEDLLQLERLTRVSRIAVAAHQYREFMNLGEGQPSTRAARLLDPDTGERLCGPILTRAAIGARLVQIISNDNNGGSSTFPKQCHWMVSTIALRAAHLKWVRLGLKSNFIPQRHLQSTNSLFEAINLHADSLLAGITFSQCTRLQLDYYIMSIDFEDQHMMLPMMPAILKHFPVLEVLDMRGHRLPLISALPAPQRLKKLVLIIENYKNTPQVDPIICDFSGLEHFSFMSRSSGTDKRELIKMETFHLLCGITGVDWKKSFKRHPPRNLEHIALPSLVGWSLSLLRRCISESSSSSCRHLTVGCLAVSEEASLCSVERLERGAVGRLLQNLTSLVLLNAAETRARHVNEFLRFTPSLVRLELVIRHYAVQGENPFDAQHSLQHLTGLSFHAPGMSKESLLSSIVTRKWARRVRRNASPAGLTIGVTVRGSNGLEHIHI